MQLIKIHPSEVKIKEGLTRFRTDGGEVLKLAQSIQRLGQLQAIVINRNNEIIAGGRRLAACTLLNIPVLAMYQDTVDSATMREMEVEENTQRKDFTPSEQALAVQELHKLKQEIYGTAIPGVKDSGWSLDKTAETLGVSRGNVIESLQIAEMIAMFPTLKTSKTKSEIKSTAKAMEKVTSALSSLKKYEETAKTKSSYKIYHQEAEHFLSSQPSNKYEVFVTDPPYGINIQDTMISIGMKTGKVNSSGISFNDSVEEKDVSIALLAKELYRITTHNAQGWIFVAPEFFYPIREVFINAGWGAYIKPVIWIKSASIGQTNQPSMYPSSCYEMILFLRKHDAKLVIEGKADWMQFQPIIGGNKLHPNEKPVELILELLDRISLPGQNMIDPFMGSGSALEAGIRKKLFVSGCDKLIECYATSLKRLEELKL